MSQTNHTLSKRLILIAACIFISTLIARAQFVNYGTDPARYKWRIVHTDNYKLIYPLGNDSMAYRYARLLETTYPYVEQTIGKSRKWKLPVVLHPSSMLSNGLVSWAPRRMELITTPSADNTAQMWDSHLVLHEGRHGFQTRKFMEGIFRPLYFLMGEQISGLANLPVPTWFLEGDAVATETALSYTGRGRLPEFNMIYRAQTESGQFYSFNKWFLGSYKNYTGNKYALGYDMTAFARHEYGGDIWDKVTTRYIKKIFNIPPFTKSLKYHTGIGKDELFNNTFSFLKQEWDKLDDKHLRSGFTPNYLLPDPKEYVTYKYPQAINNTTIIALKSSMSEISSLVEIKDGKEKHLTHVGSINSKLIYRNGKIFWNENVSGLRWSHENYSVLKYYDLQTKKIVTVTPRQRYQSPAINYNGLTAAFSEYSETGNNQIVLVNVENGTRIASYQTPENAFAKEISFGEDNQLFITSVGESGISIWALNTDNSEWKEILAPTWANITSTFWHDGNLYLESGLDGTNNIYSIDIQSKKVYKLTTSRFGAFTPALSADNSKLLFSDYQKNGYRLASVSLNDLQREAANFNEPYKFALAESISNQESFRADTAQLKEIDFKPKRYNRTLNLFKIHSWAPFYYDVTDIINMDVDDFSTIVKPGAMVLSQNSLNTAISQLGWFYKDGAHHGKFAFNYTGWYPVIDFNVTYGDKAFNLEWHENEEGKENLGYSYTGRTLLEAEARISIPFNLTRNHYIRGVQPSITYYYTNNKIQQKENRKLSDFQYLLPEVRIYNYRKMAARDILPKWGYQLRLQTLAPLSTGDLFGQLYAARLTNYFPGFLPNNSLMVRLGYQYQNMDNKSMYIPKKLLTAPRGYHYNSATNHLFEFKSDYAFTIAYPDYNLGWLMYIKRFRSNVFFDLSANKAVKTSWNTQSSAGVDFIMDWHAIETEFPLSLGVRLIKPFEKGGISAEVLMSVSF
ncbi:hypothetical protein [Bacteroides sp. 519]|uniref:TolB family protein n=1 Tax=Bacteroides sp. 519 TaxID=2302937 RepID=UPI0013D5E2FD|nr:hypothetical protein [Bacteroides sp. 519]NDV60627.1 hypothetical protein [Bacteroides sp. 519]